ncbi:MAG: site-specific integrase [Planctomycetes bacterium]|nr:site-specific integrase [Planctomycetota bacterium]
MPNKKKPKKPRRDFPLFWHQGGQWCKKIRGKFYYFGTDPEQAEAKYKREENHLRAGRTTNRTHGPDLTVRAMVNLYLTSMKNRLDVGQLSARSFRDYFSASESLVEFFGDDRVMDLRPENFERYQAKLAKTLNPVSLGNATLRARIIFNWALKNDYIERPPRFGTSFQMPSAKVKRRAKRESGKRTFDAPELRKIIASAGQPLRAMILLALNGGLGQTDLAAIPLRAIDFKSSLINFPRVKTETDRRFFLWPETVKAAQEAIKIRPDPKDRKHDGLAFLTIQGRPWVRHLAGEGRRIVFTDAVAQEFNKILRKLKLKRRGSFYNLRHCFRTVADAVKDAPAVDAIMGHVDPSMGANYVSEIGDERLRAVTDHVRAWLWPNSKATARRKKVK